MNKKLAGMVAAGGAALVVFGFLANAARAGEAATAGWIGWVAGGLCLAWAAAAWGGWRRRIGVVLTLVPAGFLLLGQAIRQWNNADGRSAAVWLTLMLAVVIALLLVVLHGGEQPPSEIAQRGVPPAGARKA